MCAIIGGSIMGGICLIGIGTVCCGVCKHHQRVATNADCIVITKEHYENLKNVGSCKPPEYTDELPVYVERESTLN